MEFSENGWISVPSVGAEGVLVEAAALVLILLGIVAAAAWIRPSQQRPPRRRWSGQPWRNRHARPGRGARAVLAPVPPVGVPAPLDRFDVAAEQMRVVAKSGFERVPLLNKEEARVLPLLEGVAREANQGHRVMAQTSLGEVIRPVAGSPEGAYAAINSKRLDFAVFDQRGLIVCAVEYQGTGHWQGQAAMRDSVKREALRKAGVRVVEVHPDFVASTLTQSVRDLLAGRERSGGEGGEGEGA